jgi:DNA repair protein RadC
MPNEKFIESLSKFTKIPKNKIQEYLTSNDLSNLFEHPETMDITQNQLKNLKNLLKLNSFYSRVSNYKEYKFEKTTDMVDYLDSHFYSKFDKEYFLTAFLDKENKLLGIETISTGTVNASIVHPRDVFKQALIYKADKIVLSHNHPSGEPAPSNEDLRITERLENVGKLFNITVLDHIIIGKNDYYSFKEKGHIVADTTIEKTSNKFHKTLYKKDVEKFSSLLNKITKIPKTELKNILRETTVKNFIQSPELHLNKEKDINSVNMLKDISLRYNNASYLASPKIREPNDLQDYVNDKYKNMDKIDVVMFLDTKNKIINSSIIPENLSNDDKIAFIMKNAILHDSNSYALATKDKSLPSSTNIDRINEIQDISSKSKLVGINLIDKIDIKLYDGVSYKQMNFLEERNHYKSPPKKISMEDRFKNAIAEAEKRNNNQEKSKITKNKDHQL